jgi:hypothetical protein
MCYKASVEAFVPRKRLVGKGTSTGHLRPEIDIHNYVTIISCGSFCVSYSREGPT